MSREIYDKISELACLIIAGDEYAALKSARQAGAEDPALCACQAAYAEKRSELDRETEAESRDFDKISELIRELDELNGQMEQLPAYRAIRQARGALSTLLQGVTAALQGIVDPEVSCECRGECGACGCGCAPLR